ncbi:hypothetical protein I7I53_09944 [Histoplasma capsulatum var. duboisii H88]|uniref:Uncharacterized protein n=1 Tax=Ajellomyces capsulatus (strain H88) TaxID=544711 RepID=A0A8A1L7N1_AJEC8|nr:hypothetical protein I7I53_09944 [Histoplasma capsulatum var. duboisii H88]
MGWDGRVDNCYLPFVSLSLTGLHVLRVFESLCGFILLCIGARSRFTYYTHFLKDTLDEDLADSCLLDIHRIGVCVSMYQRRTSI